MLTVLNVYKPIGKTPLQVIEALRQIYPEYKTRKITYAGRLDPMAHGVLLLLVEPETKNSKSYHAFNKEYQCEAVFGFTSDTYDILGLPATRITSTPNLSEITQTMLGKQIQQYPPYSSATVKGKPLFQWAREGKLHEIVIPQKEIEVYSLRIEKTYQLTANNLLEQIDSKINKVAGDFRQAQILSKWKEILVTNDSSYLVARMTMACSSGTYVRGLIDSIGQKMGGGALALDILRTKVGMYSLKKSLRLY